MDQKRNIYLECLCRKGIALCRLYFVEDNKNEILESIANCWRSLVRFTDPSDSKVCYYCVHVFFYLLIFLQVVTSYVIYFLLWHARVYEHYGRLMKYTQRMQEDRPHKDLEEKIIELCKLNEWEYLASHHLRNLPSKFPSAYQPF